MLNGKLIKIITGNEERVFSLAFSPNGDYLASIYRVECYFVPRDCCLGVWRVSSGDCIKRLRIHPWGVSSVVFSPNGEYLASGSYDGAISLCKFFN